MNYGRALGRGFMAFGVAATLAFLGTVASAQAEDAKIRAGTLTCKGKGGVGLIIGSQQQLDCTYSPASGAPNRRLKGKITNIGLDIGIKGPSVIVWAVLGSSSSLPAEALSGQFAGVAADASLGLGAGAQVLLGGNKKSVVLQPLSVKGETGINIAVGVAGLTLMQE
jgi:hypothetical protein